MRSKSFVLVLAAVAVIIAAGCAVDPMEQLTQNVDSQKVDVRAKAVLALANLDDDRATDLLVDVLQSDEDMCDEAGVALVKKGREWPAKKKPNAVVDAVAKVAANTHLLDKTRARACWVLGEIGDRQAVPALKGLLADAIVPVATQSKIALEKLGYYTEGRAFDIPMGQLSGHLDLLPQPKPVIPPPAPATTSGTTTSATTTSGSKTSGTTKAATTSSATK